MVAFKGVVNLLCADEAVLFLLSNCVAFFYIHTFSNLFIKKHFNLWLNFIKSLFLGWEF